MSDKTDELFLQAREITDPQERADFLAQTCQDDPDLLARLEQLLKDEAQARLFFDETDDGEAGKTVLADTLPDDSAAGGEREGQWIGRYRLLQCIGEGGFGSVWMAEQNEPVLRRVAVKIIKQGMDTREVVARFEAERQALSMMDHPNIAKVLDAGATNTGRPYFVMELVKGKPVNRFCEEWKLDMEQRLLLFGEICAAINHAHQKGIIHRDIKPSNVLVTLHGDRPVPMVIDFGIAKATMGKLTNRTLFTRYDQFIGTPAYMSPEQVGMSGLDVDTRSDIYSLGVMLYELLAGSPPFDPKTLLSAGWEEMIRIIREVDPPSPSSRLSTTADDESEKIVARLGANPKKLGRLIQGELDWIVMKALEKDRSRRYESANALADDIHRYLASEPVMAAPPSVSYQFQKFFRRHRLTLGVAVMIAVTLAVATAVSTRAAIRATRAEREVTRLLDEAKVREVELTNAVALLKESTEELSSHMRRLLVGRWEIHLKFDEESLKKNLKNYESSGFKSLFTGPTAEVSSQVELKEDGAATGETFPSLVQITRFLTPLPDKEQIREGRWDLVKQQGKRTTVNISSRNQNGFRSVDEFTLTVIDSGTLLMENTAWADGPIKPIITFRRMR